MGLAATLRRAVGANPDSSFHRTRIVAIGAAVRISRKRPISHSLVSSGGEKLPLGCIDGLGRIGRLPAFLG